MTAEHVNDRGRVELLEQARLMREGFINDCFESLVLYLDDQEIAHDLISQEGYKPGTEIHYTIMDEDIFVPGEEGDQSTLTFLLKPEDEDDSGTVDSLRIYVPVAEELTLNEYVDAFSLPRPDYVVALHKTSEGAESWFMVAKDRVLPFATDKFTDASSTPDEMVDDDIATEIMLREITKRVDSGLPTISWLREMLINMTVVVQDTHVIGVMDQKSD